jgi:hypothetical protein
MMTKMEEVKNEKFGTRNSLLKQILKEENIFYCSNIWVVTCRYAINKDKNSRYLVCIEGEIDDEKIANLVKNVKSYIPVINVVFNEEEQEVSIITLRDNKKSTVSYLDFKNLIIKRTQCKYLDSYAMGSSESTPFSRFFRENMGKGFALTDIDFFISKKNLFIEEKNFVNKNKGYLGIGQCISMKEIVNDVFQNMELIIVCIDENNFFTSNIKNINCYSTEIIEGWGKMVAFDLTKTTKNDFIKNLME